MHSLKQTLCSNDCQQLLLQQQQQAEALRQQQQQQALLQQAATLTYQQPVQPGLDFLGGGAAGGLDMTTGLPAVGQQGLYGMPGVDTTTAANPVFGMPGNAGLGADLTGTGFTLNPMTGVGIVIDQVWYVISD